MHDSESTLESHQTKPQENVVMMNCLQPNIFSSALFYAPSIFSGKRHNLAPIKTSKP